MPSCLIVGASRGIGREFVAQYLKDGWTVYATARKDADIADLTEAGATAFGADAADEKSLKSLAAKLPGDLDLVVHNAGISRDTREGPMADIVPEEWMETMRVNALGPILSARQLTPKLKRPGGTFAVLSSLMGSVADNGWGGFWSYRMSKAAANMAVKNLSLQLKEDGIRVVALHPGHVQTDMGGSSAPVTPAESVSGLRETLSQTAAGQHDDELFRDYKGRSLPW